MRNKKAVLAGALIAPALALTGGIAYASSGPGTSPAVTRPAVITTVQAHTATQSHHGGYCGWQYRDDRCGWRGHYYQRQPVQQRTQRHATRHYSHRSGHGYQRGGHQHHGYQGSWGYQGGSSWRGSDGGCCHGGW